MPLSELSFLVLSDIHFGRLAGHSHFALPGTQLNGHEGYKVSMKSDLIRAVRERGGKIDAILVPGDLTSAASPLEFIGCWQIIKELAQALDVDPNLIFHTYGNHDTNWKISALGKAANGISDPHYSSVAALVGDIFCPVSPNFQRGPFAGSGVYQSDKLSLFVANSGLFCTDEQAVKHGSLGQDQLGWLKEELNKTIDTEKWRILMIHHHPFNSPYPTPIHDISFLEEGDALVEIIASSNVDFVCHGHRHHPVLRTHMENDWHTPCTFFCAGSVSVNANHRASGNIKNMFHIVKFCERHASTNGALGNIETYGFTISKGWIPHQASPDADLDPLCHFGSVAPLAERRQLLGEMLDQRLAEAPENPIYLPNWSELHQDLKFRRYSHTAQLLEEATKQRGLTLFQNYPQLPVVLT